MEVVVLLVVEVRVVEVPDWHQEVRVVEVLVQHQHQHARLRKRLLIRELRCL